jgi:NADH-ubiquinone oxidoreductase chain 5
VFAYFYLTFIATPNGFKKHFEHAHEPGPLMSIPLFFLAIASTFGGWIFSDVFLGMGTTFWGTSIAQPVSDTLSTLYSAEFLEVKFKLLTATCVCWWQFIGVSHFYEGGLYR